MTRVLYHRGGPVPCYKPAFGVARHMTFPRHDIPADNVVLLNGKTPARGDPMLCGSCRNPVVPQWLYYRPDAP
jgi:hypothetical protein